MTQGVSAIDTWGYFWIVWRFYCAMKSLMLAHNMDAAVLNKLSKSYVQNVENLGRMQPQKLKSKENTLSVYFAKYSRLKTDFGEAVKAPHSSPSFALRNFCQSEKKVSRDLI